MSSRCISFLVLILVVVTGAGVAQESKIEEGQQYLLLSTTRTSTMQRELDAAAGLGFRIITGTPTVSGDMVVLMERVAHPPDTYKYKLLAARGTATLQRELEAAAEEGFRLLPRTLMTKRQLLIDPEIVAILERPPNSATRYTYQLLTTARTSTLQEQIQEASQEGYAVSGVVSRGTHMVFMEREIKPEKAAETTPAAETEVQ